MRARVIGIVAAVVVVVAAFLPWEHLNTIFGSSTRTGMDRDGPLTAVGAAAAGGLLVVGRRRPLVAAAVLFGLVAALGLYDWIDVARVDGSESNEGGVRTSVAYGVPITVVAAAVGAAAAVVAALARPVKAPARS